MYAYTQPLSIGYERFLVAHSVCAHTKQTMVVVIVVVVTTAVVVVVMVMYIYIYIYVCFYSTDSQHQYRNASLAVIIPIRILQMEYGIVDVLVYI